jgi:hypothetical protein
MVSKSYLDCSSTNAAVFRGFPAVRRFSRTGQAGLP